MAEKCDILVTGTGAFVERLVFDLAITADKPVTVAVAGRNEARMTWLSTAGNARAALFGRPVIVVARPVVWDSAETIARVIDACRPNVVVHAATVQSPKDVRGKDTPWTRLLRQAGGFGATGLLQMLLSSRAAQAMRLAGNSGAFVNAGYPDLVNPVLAAKGLPVTCGLGNVEIMAALFAGALGLRRPGAVRVLAHHHNLHMMRAPIAERGTAPRVWVEGKELDDVHNRFAAMVLPAEPLHALAGAAGVNIVLALAGHKDHVGHAPGPDGRPGGYPVVVKDRKLSLNLPDGLGADEAVAWNRSFGEHEGLILGDDGKVRYSAAARAAFAAHAPAIAEGFHIDDIEPASAAMLALRHKLEG